MTSTPNSFAMARRFALSPITITGAAPRSRASRPCSTPRPLPITATELPCVTFAALEEWMTQETGSMNAPARKSRESGSTCTWSYGAFTYSA